MPLSSALPSSESRNVSSARRSARSSERQALRVGVVEDEREALLLRLVGAQHLGQQLRPEVRHRRPHRHAGADAAEREELDREAGGANGSPRSACASRPGRPPRRARQPDRSPLMSAANTGTPAADSCSAISCSVFVLPVPVAPAISPWRFIIAERDLDDGLGASSPSCTPRPSSIARALGRVGLGDRRRRSRPSAGLDRRVAAPGVVEADQVAAAVLLVPVMVSAHLADLPLARSGTTRCRGLAARSFPGPGSRHGIVHSITTRSPSSIASSMNPAPAQLLHRQLGVGRRSGAHPGAAPGACSSGRRRRRSARPPGLGRRC